jgi:short subunit dehydrogenase-like uncharacterized protein
MSDRRSFDLIVFGATGFTGKYVAKHLLSVHKKKEESFRFAIAGRSDAKLKGSQQCPFSSSDANICTIDLVAELGSNVPTVVADVGQEISLVEMCKQTKVLINCVGPVHHTI